MVCCWAPHPIPVLSLSQSCPGMGTDTEINKLLKYCRRDIKASLGTMCLVKVHKPISMNKHHLKSFMNCILIGKTPGIEIWMIQDDPKWFSGPNILNFLNYFCSNLPKFHYGGFLSIGLAIFWYNLSENVFGVLKFQKEKLFCFSHFSKMWYF